MKKIILSLVAMSIAANAAPYVGAKIGGSFLKTKSTIAANANVRANKALALQDIKNNLNINNNGINIGLLFGYAFKMNEQFNILTELDLDYGFSSAKKTQHSMTVNGLSGTVPGMLNENLSIKSGLGFGFMPAVSYNFNEKFSGLFGVRMSMNQYKVHVHHENLPNNLIRINPLNDVSKKAFVFGVEPTLGVQMKISDKISGRFTVGYLISQKKKIVSNYLGAANYKTNGESAGVEIQPSGIRLSASLIYSF